MSNYNPNGKPMMMRMIKEWLLRQILRNRIVLFEHGQEYTVINDIYFDDGVMICKNINWESDLDD